LRSILGGELYGGSKLTGAAWSVGKTVYDGLTDAMNKAAAQEGMAGAFSDANKLHGEYMRTFVDRKSPLAKVLRGNNPHEIMGPVSDPKFAEQARRIMKQYQRHGIDPAQVSKEGIIFQKLKSGLPEQSKQTHWELVADVAAVGGGVAGALTGDPRLLGMSAGALVTPARLGLNMYRRARAIGELERPQAFDVQREAPRQPMRAEEAFETQMREGTPSWLSKLRQEPETPVQAPSSMTPQGAARHAQALQMAKQALGDKYTIQELIQKADEIERGMR